VLATGVLATGVTSDALEARLEPSLPIACAAQE